jgi:hypothetical protein
VHGISSRSVKLEVGSGLSRATIKSQQHANNMEVLTAKAARRSTRVRVEIPITVTSLDRLRPFAEKCVALVVSCQGCGFRSSRALQLETPVFLSDLPGGGSVTARVASCVRLGNDAEHFLVGVSLYTHGNVWGISDPPADWDCATQGDSSTGNASQAEPGAAKQASSKGSWPYNMFSEKAEAHRK